MDIAGWIDYNNIIAEENLNHMSRALGGDTLKYMQKEAALLQKRTGKCELYQKQANGELYTILFSGALKNAAETARELKCLNYGFDECSDAQTALCAFLEWGENCPVKLNGAYCFAVWKQNEKTLLLVRDRLGAVPLYYYKYDGGIIFGGIQAIMQNGLVPRKVGEEGLLQILLLGPGKISGSGIVKGVKELKPAHYIIFGQQKFEEKCYWRLTARKHEDDFEQTAGKTRELIFKSYKGDLDKSAAYMLSGGLDSSIICALARSKGITPHVYSVDFEDNEKNFARSFYQPERDIKYIETVARHICAEHTHIVLKSADLADAIEEAFEARGLPGMADVDASLLLFCKKISQNHSACYSGECADELFGGYPWFHREEMLKSGTFAWGASLPLRKKLFKKEYTKNADEFVKNLYQETVKQTECLPQDSPKQKRIREMFTLNYQWFAQTLLDRGYKMSAACGVWIKMPFCDYEAAEYAYNIPWEYMTHNGREKGLLREAFKNMLPPDVVRRKKSPFPKTYSPKFFNIVKDKLLSKLNGGGLLASLVDIKFLKSLASNPNRDIPNWYGQLMRLPQIFGYLLQLDSFFDKYNMDIES
jgi:asparagine synthase (glutamine-hydrolysing)